MTRLTTTFFFTAFLISQIALAGLPPTSTKSQLDTSKSTTFDFQAPFNQFTKPNGTTALIETGNKNLLKDPGFESSDPTAVWVISGAGTVGRTSTAADVGSGSYALSYDAAATNGTVTSAAVAVPNGFIGKTLEASCDIKNTSAGLYKIQVYDGTNVLSEQRITTDPTYYVRNTLRFPSPTSGSISIRFLSGTAGEPVFYADDCYLGLASNVGSTQLISETTSWSPAAVALTSGSITNATSTGTYSRNGDRAKVKTMTSFSAPSAAFSGFRMSLPPGCVIDTAKVANDPSFSVSVGYASLLDSGVSHYAVSGKVALISGDNQNVAVTWATTNYAQTAITNTAPFTFAGGDTISTDFEVPCVGWTAQTTASIDAISKRGSIYFASGSATITGALATFNTAAFGANTPEGQALAPTTANDLGIRMTGAPAAVYEVTATGKFYASSAAGTGTRTVCEYRLYDGTNHSPSAYAIAAGGGATEVNDAVGTITGIFNLSSAGTINIVVRGQRVAGNGTCYAEGGAYISIKNVSQNSPAIILANSVSSAATNGTHFNSSQVGSTGTVSKETGDWISGSCSVGSAVYTCTLVAGAFNADPACHATIFGETTNYNAIVTSASTSTVVVRTFDTANAAAAAAFSLTCSGPR